MKPVSAGISTHLLSSELPWQTELVFDCDCAMLPGHMGAQPLALPIIYALELTHACNNQCVGCSNTFVSVSLQGEGDVSAPLSARQWDHILSTIAPFAQQLKITGGEPTCHPEFGDILHAVRRYGLPFTLFTNGCWHQPESTLALLCDMPLCAGLLISLHGADAATHDAFTRVPGSFDQAVETIRRATHAGLTVHTNTILRGDTCQHVAEIVHLSQALGVARAVFNRYIGLPAPHLDLSPADLHNALNEIGRLQQAGASVAVGTCVPHCFSEQAPDGCAAGIAACTIDPWGYVRPCNHAPQIVGNILVEPLDTIWHSVAMESWRTLVPAVCRTCAAFEQCHGGCRADAVLRGKACDTLLNGHHPQHVRG